MSVASCQNKKVYICFGKKRHWTGNGEKNGGLCSSVGQYRLDMIIIIFVLKHNSSEEKPLRFMFMWMFFCFLNGGAETHAKVWNLCICLFISILNTYFKSIPYWRLPANAPTRPPACHHQTVSSQTGRTGRVMAGTRLCLTPAYLAVSDEASSAVADVPGVVPLAWLVSVPGPSTRWCRNQISAPSWQAVLAFVVAGICSRDVLSCAVP